MQDILLVSAGDNHNDLLGSHNGADTHSDGGLRNIVDGIEEALVGIDGHFRQLNLVGHSGEIIFRLVEADMSVVANAQQLQIHAAPLLDLGLVGNR